MAEEIARLLFWGHITPLFRENPDELRATGCIEIDPMAAKDNLDPV
jgi:hypothetical protein